MTLQGSSIAIEGATDHSNGINVTSGGYLDANDTSIASSNGLPYTFRVNDRMDLDRVRIGGVFGGVLVSTSEPVRMDRVWVLDFDGPGLVLRDANGTRIKGIHFQSDWYVTRYHAMLATNGSKTYVEWDHIQPGIVIIDGGGPEIDGVDISINGTFTLDLDYRRDNAGGGLGLDLDWALVHVDSMDRVVIRNVTLRHSAIYVSMVLDVTSPIAGSFALDAYYGVDIVLFRDHWNASVAGMRVEQVTYYDLLLNVTGVPFDDVTLERSGWAIRAVRAVVNETFTDVGPHDFDLELRDIHLSRVPILNHSLLLSYSGSTSPTFRSKVILDNVSASHADHPVVLEIIPTFALEKTVFADVTISNSTFDWLGTSAITVDYYQGPCFHSRRGITYHARTEVIGTTFTMCNAGTHGLINVPARWYNYPSVDLDFNTFIVRNSTFSQNVGTLLNINGSVTLTRDRLVIDGNAFANNTAWLDQCTMFLVNRTVIEFTNNTIVDNSCSQGILFSDLGFNSMGRDPCRFTLANNSFLGNWDNPFRTTPGEIVNVIWGGELRVWDNIIADSGVIFMNLTERPALSGGSTFYFHHNKVMRNEISVLYFTNNDRYHRKFIAYLTNNTVWDNEGALVDYQESDEIQWHDYNARYYLLNNDVRRSSSTVFRNYGNITVSNNSFIDCAGWVLILDNLWSVKPYVSDNTFTRCGDTLFIRAKVYAPAPVLMWLDNNEIHCSGTAVNLWMMRLTMHWTNITSTSGRALVADRSQVDAYDCEFEMEDCEVVVDGYIRMWYWVEAYVHWADKNGVPSPNPVVNGTVTFTDKDGVDSLIVTTDAQGYLEPVNVMAWHIEHSTEPVDRNPYTIITYVSSYSTSREINITRSYKGIDLLYLLLVDPEDPLVSIDAPVNMSILNTLDVELRGFATDKASGVFRLTIQVDHGPTRTIDGPDVDGAYLHLLEEVPEGVHVIMVTVYDAALNKMAASVTTEVDRTPPMLLVTYPPPESHTNRTEVTIRGEVEVGADLVMNMRPMTVWNGTFETKEPLNEGTNGFWFEATDRAGNVAQVVITVHRDTYDPLLRMVGPYDGAAFNSSAIRVWGMVEEYDTVTITLHRPFTDVVDLPIVPEEDGRFEIWVELEEGANELLVTARDLADNHVTQRRTVILDTRPPVVEVLSPEDDALVNVRRVTVRFLVSEDADKVLFNGKRILGVGELEASVMLDEGDNPISLVAYDAVWNEVSVTINLVLDTIPPTLVLTHPGTGTFITNEPSVEVRGRVTDENMNGIVVTVEGDLVTSLTTEGNFYHSLVLEGDGTHKIDVKVRDVAGNSITRSFTVDLRTRAPVLNLVFDPNRDFARPGTVLQVRGASADYPLMITVVHTVAGDRREHTFDMANATFEYDIELGDGENNITVEAVDKYGNWAVSAPHIIVVKEGRNVPSVDPERIAVIIISIVIVALLISTFILLRRKREDQ